MKDISTLSIKPNYYAVYGFNTAVLNRFYYKCLASFSPFNPFITIFVLFSAIDEANGSRLTSFAVNEFENQGIFTYFICPRNAQCQLVLMLPELTSDMKYLESMIYSLLVRWLRNRKTGH